MARNELRASSTAVTRIVEAGVEEFGKKGMAGATMSGIALRAGISKQLIYHYYRKKEELYCEVIQFLGPVLHAPFFEADYHNMSSLAAIEKFFNVLMDTSLSKEGHFFADQMLHSGDQLRTNSMQPFAARLIGLLERLLARAEADGSIRRGVNADFLLFQGILLASGFTSAKVLMSRYLNRDFTTPEIVATWRCYAMHSLMRTLDQEPCAPKPHT